MSSEKQTNEQKLFGFATQGMMALLAYHSILTPIFWIYVVLACIAFLQQISEHIKGDLQLKYDLFALTSAAGLAYYGHSEFLFWILISLGIKNLVFLFVFPDSEEGK